jgi:hypothetical protein
MFDIKPIDPHRYRRETRRSSLLIVAVFAVLGLGMATLSVHLFGEPGGNNLRWNLGGVLAGLALTVALVRAVCWQRPSMDAARYGWRLKRSLMRVTNSMHLVEQRLAADDPTALRVLRFYHLALDHMRELDGHSGEPEEDEAQREQVRLGLERHGLTLDQTRFDPAWIERIRQTCAGARKG